MAWTMRLDPNEEERLAARAQAEGRSKQEITRDAISDYLNNTSTKALEGDIRRITPALALLASRWASSRSSSIASAIASVEMEGGTVDAATRADMERVERGEITSEDAVSAALERLGVRHA